MPDEIAAIAKIAILGWVVVSVASMFVGRKSAVKPAELRDIDARLLRIEQAVDAIAIEMERVTEGQRFATRLLSERPGVTLPASSGSGARDRASS